MVKPTCLSRVFLDHIAQDCVLFTTIHAYVIFEGKKREDKDYCFKIRQVFDSRLSYSLLAWVRHFPSSSI